MKINNIPRYSIDYKFFVVREIDDEYWFYGAYDNRNRANDVAMQIDGIVIENDFYNDFNN